MLAARFLTVAILLAYGVAQAREVATIAEPQAQPAAPAQASAQALSSGKWVLSLPSEGTVPFDGIVTFDHYGNNKGEHVQVTAPNIATGIAGLILGGLLVKGISDAGKEKVREEANLVLQPFRPVLDKFNYARLTAPLEQPGASAKLRLASGAQAGIDELVMESRPLFSLTQDKRSLVLSNLVQIQSAGRLLWENQVRVVSPVFAAEDMNAFWNEQEGRKLLDESQRLYLQSVQAVMAHWRTSQTTDSAQFKTVRYQEGGVEQFERALVLQEHCDRRIFKNLRGQWLILPASPGADAAACKPAA
ncbi:hypothetical protein V8J88_08280 [Massilia sp. W12]|uniref:hypothetical protein n=1 Tax=Massilia sp. W12 TaxID=3126507 RepID=UPI0030CFA331